MIITVQFPSYNERRYSKPWIAKVVSWAPGQHPEINWGSFNGRPGEAGEAEIEAVAGDVIRWGQKDNRNPRGTECNWGIVNDDGSITNCSASEAAKAFRNKSQIIDNPLAKFTTEELLAEIARREVKI